jgi:hypothetical protein
LGPDITGALILVTLYDEGKITCLPVSSVEMKLSDTATASVSPELGSVCNNLWPFSMYSKHQCSTAITKLYFAAKLFLNSGMLFFQIINSVQKSTCLTYFAGFNYMECDDSPKLS